MLAPFFKPASEVGNLLTLDRNPDTDERDDFELSDLEIAMHPLLKAIQEKDIKKLAEAFQDAMDIAKSTPKEGTK